jgi:hypothetical protein
VEWRASSRVSLLARWWFDAFFHRTICALASPTSGKSLFIFAKVVQVLEHTVQRGWNEEYA